MSCITSANSKIHSKVEKKNFYSVKKSILLKYNGKVENVKK